MVRGLKQARRRRNCNQYGYKCVEIGVVGLEEAVRIRTDERGESAI